ncbi:hypothetical protein [Polyangium fumosum]|uniref:Uncharacterized protein n=1 Tax=Polyangium fumosum TaxID=889272 RepID=A0A4U1J7R2_9BACT|nr:hypothetical protein [Polyangium fumosum]TKD03237.1 hypothetical protein E8A74_26220 [Polyangium fumosum]
MKTRVEVEFNGRSIPGGEQVVLEAARCGVDVARVEDIEVLNKTFVEVTLDHDDPRLPVLLRLLQDRGVKVWERRWDEYTEAEFHAAPLLLLAPPAWTYNVNGGPRWGTQYDLSAACPVCAAGARQTSALMVDGVYRENVEMFEENRAVTSRMEILVDDRLAETLTSAGLSGLSFRGVCQVQEDGRRVELPWRQICAAHTMPSVSPRSIGFGPRRVCPSCGRSGFSMFDEMVPTRLAYRARDVVGAEDVNRMWEYFGDVEWKGELKTAMLPYTHFLVTPKVRRIFLDAGVTGFDWLPIRVVDV